MKKVILLLGPTGVGKTAVSILLAEALNSEIISADSMQIYRHMDTGTAKPSAEELQRVKHHMIDVVEPWESFSTGMFISRVSQVIDSLLEKRKTPVIVGGTGLYIKAMTRGIFSGPSADWDLRKDLLSREEDQPGSLYAYLKDLDADAAARIMPADIRRIIRAIEVCLRSESKLSEMQEKHTKPLPYEFVKIGLTRDRKELYRLIDQRVEMMMEKGLLDEVKKVMELIHGNTAGESLPMSNSQSPIAYSSMQAIGYKEMAMHLTGELGLKDAVALIKQRSRNYAKRQFTWFKKEEGIGWVDISGVFDPNEIFQKIKETIPF